MSYAARPEADNLSASSAAITSNEDLATSALRDLWQLDRLVHNLVASWEGPASARLERSRQRMPYQGLLALTPVDDQTEQPVASPMTVRARDLSPAGVSFFHSSPLPFRKVALTFATAGGGVASLVTRLIWCRFTREGRYQSGGKFLRPVESPIGNDVDWTLLPTA